MTKSRRKAAFDFEKLIAGGSAPAPWVTYLSGSVIEMQRKVACLGSHRHLASRNRAPKARDVLLFQYLLLPGVQQNPLHPFGGVNTR